jgi:putative ubiquitin-RnfH superfamily antitoxin RatB of RatAB toxin-antitoxin module
MPDKDTIDIEVAYALPGRQRVVSLQVQRDAAVRDILDLSGLKAEFPELDLRHCPVGVYGREVGEDYVIRAGDRIEIYRPLKRDPREARRELAARGLTM